MSKIAKKHKAEPSEEEATEEKSGRKGRKSTGSASRSASGWGSYEERRRTNSVSDREFKPQEAMDESFLIKFAQDRPFDNFLQHWIDDVPKNTKKSYICPEDDDGEVDCPLDDIGDKPSTFSLFNVIVLGQQGKKKFTPSMKVWKASVTVADKIKRLSEEKRSSPLNRENLYFVVKVTKPNKNRTDTDITAIKDVDLEEDGWKVKPLSAKEIETWNADVFENRSAIVKLDTKKELKQMIKDNDL